MLLFLLYKWPISHTTLQILLLVIFIVVVLLFFPSRSRSLFLSCLRATGKLAPFFNDSHFAWLIYHSKLNLPFSLLSSHLPRFVLLPSFTHIISTYNSVWWCVFVFAWFPYFSDFFCFSFLHRLLGVFFFFHYHILYLHLFYAFHLIRLFVSVSLSNFRIYVLQLLYGNIMMANQNSTACNRWFLNVCVCMCVYKIVCFYRRLLNYCMLN